MYIQLLPLTQNVTLQELTGGPPHVTEPTAYSDYATIPVVATNINYSQPDSAQSFTPSTHHTTSQPCTFADPVQSFGFQAPIYEQPDYDSPRPLNSTNNGNMRQQQLQNQRLQQQQQQLQHLTSNVSSAIRTSAPPVPPERGNSEIYSQSGFTAKPEVSSSSPQPGSYMTSATNEVTNSSGSYYASCYIRCRGYLVLQ